MNGVELMGRILGMGYSQMGRSTITRTTMKEADFDIEKTKDNTICACRSCDSWWSFPHPVLRSEPHTIKY